MAKEQKSGLRDPFMKWGVGGAVDAASALTIPITALKSEIDELQREITKNVGNRDIRSMMQRSLAEKKRELANLQRDAKKAVKDLNSQKNMQIELLQKLSAIRTQMMRKDLSQEILNQLLASENKLERLYLTSKNLDVSNLEKMVKDVYEAQQELEKLPEEIAEAVSGNDRVLQEILDRQKEARDFLLEQKKAFRTWAKNAGMAIADRLGFGGVSVGSALRFAGRVRRGETAVQRGFAYLSQVRQARRDAREINTDDAVMSRQSLFDKFSEYVMATKIFQRRLLKSSDKKEGDQKSLLSKLFDLGSILKGAAAFVLGGGLIKYIGGLLTGAVSALVSKIPGLIKDALSLGSKIPGALSKLPVSPATLGAIGVPAAAAAALLALTKAQKEAIEADPTNPEYKNNPYAMYLRGEASSVANAGEINRMKALKTLQPGVAKQYLEAGPDAEGKYLDGYTRTQLENMAAGRAMGEATVGTGGAVSSAAQARMPNSGLDNPALMANVEAMAQDYFNATGKTLNVADAITSSATGAVNFNNSSSQAAELRNLGLLKKYGFDSATGSATMTPTTGGSAANAKPEPMGITPTEPKAPSVIRVPAAEGATPDYRKMGGTAQPSTRLGVMDIPTFDVTAGHMLALNLGVLR